MSWEVANYIINKTKENIDELSSKEVKSADPYSYRQGKGNLADMEIVGASVGWNQLVQNGNFASTSGWDKTRDTTLTASNNELTVSTSADGNNYATQDYTGITGHKYLINIDYKSYYSSNLIVVYIGAENSSRINFTNTVTGQYRRFSKVFEAVSGSQFSIRLVNRNSLYSNKYKNVWLIDLTLLFGSTIADAIYAMEQATAGAGVAFFRKYFPKDYYAYDAGSIQSVCVGSRKVVGFNQWDEEWELGEIDTTTGQNTSASDRIRSKNYIPCIPSTDYYFRGSTDLTGNVYYYDANKNYLGTGTGSAFNIIRTIPNNVRYVRFRLAKVYGTTYKNDICINISDPAKNGTYEPYTSTAYPFDSTKQLRGMFSLVGGELKADGDIYTADGNIQRKYGIVDLGTRTWNYNDNNKFFAASIPGMKQVSSGSVTGENLICTKYAGINNTSYTAIPDKRMRKDANNANLLIADHDYTDAATFKTAMSGVYLVYDLATPTTESAQPYQNPQRAYIDGTEEFTDGLTRDVMIPVGNNTTYQQDNILPSIEDYVDSITGTKADISAIAPEENGATASKAYSVGQHFYKDGKFCTAIASIAINSSFTLNTNYVEGTIAETIEGKKAVLDIDPSAATISAYEVGTMWLKTQ